MAAFVRVMILACLLVAIGSPAFALDADLVSTEVTLNLRPDAKVEVYYRIEWNVTSGTMNAFYFQGEAFDPAWDMQRTYVDLPGEVRHPLRIDDLGGGKFDVQLADKKRYSGRAYFNLVYAGDFTAAGLLGLTTSQDLGELVYFDWAPVEWDDAMTYRAVRLVLPVQVSGEKLPEDEILALPVYSEPWVNEQNRIDYYGSPGADGTYYLTMLH
jgi:hypothetical protein